MSAGYADDKTGYWLKQLDSEITTNYDVDNHAQIVFSLAQAQYTGKEQWKFSLQVSDNYSMVSSTDHIKNLDYSARQNEFSLLGAAYKSIGERWLFSVLLRQHLINDELAKPIPSIGSEYSIFPDDKLKLKLNVSRNYHHPSLNDYYYLPGGKPQFKT